MCLLMTPKFILMSLHNVNIHIDFRQNLFQNECAINILPHKCSYMTLYDL